MAQLALLLVLILLLVPTLSYGQSLQERLGFGADDVVLIINADDAGMCHSANLAVFDAFENGVLTSATVMMPCPWVKELAEWSKTHPEADFGLHLTHTNEWNRYKWGPVAGREAVPGLCDEAGYLLQGTEDIYARGTPEETWIEARAQIMLADSLGLKYSHLDSHMGVMQYLDPYWDKYFELAKEYNLPLRLEPAALLASFGLKDRHTLLDKAGILGATLVVEPKIQGSTPEEWYAAYETGLRALGPGVHEVLLHPALPSDEIKSITGSWEHRYWDYLWLTRPETKALLDELGIKLIGYRPIMELQRRERAAVEG